MDESCYLEAEHADIFVLIVGGRYGSAVNDEKRGKPTPEKDALSTDDFYTSITRREYEKASDNIPTYILIDKNVYAEYFTYLMNKNDNILYAHVDSVNVFHFIDFIKSKPLNNPIQTFDKHTDIQNWLREQWAGLFRDLLNEQSTRMRFATLEEQVKNLSTISDTLKTYLESLIKNSKSSDAENIIDKENKRITDKIIESIINNNQILVNAKKILGINNTDLIDIITISEDINEVLANFGTPLNYFKKDSEKARDEFIRSVNEIRSLNALPPLIISNN